MIEAIDELSPAERRHYLTEVIAAYLAMEEGGSREAVSVKKSVREAFSHLKELSDRRDELFRESTKNSWKLRDKVVYAGIAGIAGISVVSIVAATYLNPPMMTLGISSTVTGACGVIQTYNDWAREARTNEFTGKTKKLNAERALTLDDATQVSMTLVNHQQAMAKQVRSLSETIENNNI